MLNICVTRTPLEVFKTAWFSWFVLYRRMYWSDYGSFTKWASQPMLRRIYDIKNARLTI